MKCHKSISFCFIRNTVENSAESQSRSMEREQMFCNRQNFLPNKSQKSGFTLIEILLSLSLIIIILGMLWSMMGMFSRSYLITENRIGRSQLVRAISQMLTDDLGAAIQDPIHPLATQESGASSVRRFGLRGSSSSLQIDVVQPNLFVANSSDGGHPHRVPELKTIYYEFLSPGQRVQKKRSESELGSSSSTLSNDNATDGSRIVGSLHPSSETNSNETALLSNDGANLSGTDVSGGVGTIGPDGTGIGFAGGMPPIGSEGGLTERFGLSRQEIDFETPMSTPSGASSFTSSDADSVNDSRFVGSLQAPPDSSNSELASSVPASKELETGSDALSDGTEMTNLPVRMPLTVSELAMSTENETMWAPEVVDCHFSYFDGSQWLSDWDSIQKNGLPEAIRGALVLMSLDDVELLRNSPEFWIWSDVQNNPTGKSAPSSALDANEATGSQFVGSLQNSLQNEAGLGDGTGMPGQYEETGVEDPNQKIKSMTFSELVRSLGLAPPMERQVIIRVPTTPLSDHQVQERRRPGQLVAGGAQQQSKNRPVGAARTNVDRTATDRTATDRTATDRTATDRTATDRTAGERQSSDRRISDRTAGERVLNERTAAERSGASRTGTESGTVFVPAEESVLSAAPEPFKEVAVPDPIGDITIEKKKPAESTRPAQQSWIRTGKR